MTGSRFVQGRQRVGNAQRVADGVDRLFLADVVETLRQRQPGQTLGYGVLLAVDVEHVEQVRQVHVLDAFGALDGAGGIRADLEDHDGRVAVHRIAGERVQPAVDSRIDAILGL